MLILFYKLQKFRWIKKACPRSHDPGWSKSDLKAKFFDIKTLPLNNIALLLLKRNGFVNSCFVKCLIYLKQITTILIIFSLILH